MHLCIRTRFYAGGHERTAFWLVLITNYVSEALARHERHYQLRIILTKSPTPFFSAAASGQFAQAGLLVNKQEL